METMAGSLVDLHCHILWSVDDGARSPEEFLAMSRGLVGLGFSDAAPSPHSPAMWRYGRVPPLERARELLLAENVPLQLHANAENTTEPEDVLGLKSRTSPSGASIGSLLSTGRTGWETVTVAGGRYVLMELPHATPVLGFHRILELVAATGHRALIAHPERCYHFRQNPDDVDLALDKGACFQLDAMSLAGAYGGAARTLALQLLDEGIYDLAGSDIHRPEDLETLSESLELLRRHEGADEFNRLFRDNPRRVLRGEDILSPAQDGES